LLRKTILQPLSLLVLLVLLSTSHLSISQAGSSSARVNVWTSHGPEGGEINALAIDPLTPATLYAGTAPGCSKHEWRWELERA